MSEVVERGKRRKSRGGGWIDTDRHRDLQQGHRMPTPPLGQLKRRLIHIKQTRQFQARERSDRQHKSGPTQILKIHPKSRRPIRPTKEIIPQLACIDQVILRSLPLE
jgi:hypothetical protein